MRLRVACLSMLAASWAWPAWAQTPPDVFHSVLLDSRTAPHVWSAWRWPGELVWSLATDCGGAGALVPGGETLVAASCPVPHESGGRQVVIHEPIVARIGATGKVVWAKRLDFGDYEKVEQIRVAPDGTFYASGTRSLCPGRAVCRESVLLRLTGDGEIIWARALNHASEDEARSLHDFRVTEDGNLIGTSSAGLWRMDADGNVRWIRRYRASNGGRWMELLTVQKELVVVRSQSIVTEAEPARDIVIVLDYDGNLHWARSVAAGPSDEIASASVSERGTIHLVGNTIRMGLSLEDKVYPRAGWMLEMAADGALLGSATIDSRAGTLLVRVSASPEGPILVGREKGMTILTFAAPGNECAAPWPIATESAAISVSVEASAADLTFTDIEVRSQDHALLVARPDRPFARPCPDTISMPWRDAE